MDVARGETLQISGKNNACFGAAWHMGFRRLNDPEAERAIKKFVVEGEKLFSSYEALDNLIGRMGDVPDNSGSFFAAGSGTPFTPIESLSQMKSEGCPLKRRVDDKL